MDNTETCRADVGDTEERVEGSSPKVSHKLLAKLRLEPWSPDSKSIFPCGGSELSPRLGRGENPGFPLQEMK